MSRAHFSSRPGEYERAFCPSPNGFLEIVEDILDVWSAVRKLSRNELLGSMAGIKSIDSRRIVGDSPKSFGLPS